MMFKVQLILLQEIYGSLNGFSTKLGNCLYKIKIIFQDIRFTIFSKTNIFSQKRSLNLREA